MAKRQYRVSTTGSWISNFGYSFLALINQSGSGRKLTIRQINTFVLTQKGAAAATCTGTLYTSATPFYGEDMAINSVVMDSATSIPSTVVVRRGGMIQSFSTPGQRYDLVRRGGIVGTQDTVHISRPRHGARHLFGGHYNRGSVRGNGDVEAITVPQNTGIALVANNTMSENQPIRVNLIVSINGKTATWNFIAVPIPGLAVWSLENTGTDVVKLLSFSTSELGTSDTPFIRIVPIGQNYAQDLLDTSKTSGYLIEKMDSQYPNLTALKVLGDVGFIPSGSPEVVINEGSTGAPKGVNYLHTRDFNGPCYRTFLPEMRQGSGVSGNPLDMLGHSNGFTANDMLTRMHGVAREGFTINPGEGLALVASSETFVGVQPSYSGWPALHFQAIIDSEPQISPTLTLTGLKNPTEVRVYSAGTTTLLTGEENVTSGTFSWAFDPDVVTAVDISILSLGYQNLRLLNVATLGNVSQAIQQQIDRQYNNP